MINKKTVILGATTNPMRYAHMAAMRLVNNGHDIVPIGIKKGQVEGEEILDITQKPAVEDVDTVTLYMNPDRQREWEDYILTLRPKRIIFNPGTENQILASKAQAEGIETLNACTLVMLGNGLY